ncbi:hypothetical protein RNR50_002140 [Salmonella enterica]|nr:hypothetical protein [Salmonella enterica]
MTRGNQFQDEDSGVLLYHNPETRETEILIDEHRRGQSAVQTAMMRLLNENARASTRFVSRPVLQNCRQTQDRQATSGEPGLALKDLVGLSGVRYSHKPTADGLHLSLAQSGFLPEQVVLVKRILRQPEGMAILSGPTGSGKFATLKRLLTVEKPPEGRIPGSIRTPVICDRADEAEVRRTRERTIFPSRGQGTGAVRPQVPEISGKGSTLYAVLQMPDGSRPAVTAGSRVTIGKATLMVSRVSLSGVTFSDGSALPF